MITVKFIKDMRLHHRAEIDNYDRQINNRSGVGRCDTFHELMIEYHRGALRMIEEFENEFKRN